jgi:hypothetical protein
VTRSKRRSNYLTVILVALLFSSLPLTTFAFAENGGPYDVTWFDLSGGGGESRGGPYVVAGTIGQPEPGRTEGGDYTLTGGFWSVGVQRHVYLPLVLQP